MKLSVIITKGIDLIYLKPIRKIIPSDTFRYAICGGMNLLLGWFIYWLLFKMVDGHYLDLRLVVMSPHITSLCIQFVITSATGFWLNRHVTFSLSTLSGRTQLMRYTFQLAGSFVLVYLLTKLFVEGLHLYAPFTRPLTDIIVVIYSYITAKFFTFGKK